MENDPLRMKLPIWTVLPLFQPSPQEIVGMVAAAESFGLTGVLATDHLAGWRQPSDPVLEATTVLGMAAAVAGCRVGSLVLQSGLRSPSYTARVVETLAAICRAPPLIGLGMGDTRSQREAGRLGMAHPLLRERFALLRQTIAAVRSRTPGAEIWVGGWRPEILELAAELADGWNGWGGEVSAFEAAAAQIRHINPAVQVSWGGLLDTSLPLSVLHSALLRRVEAGAQSLVVALTPPRVATFRRWAPPILGHSFFQPAAGRY